MLLQRLGNRGGMARLGEYHRLIVRQTGQRDGQLSGPGADAPPLNRADVRRPGVAEGPGERRVEVVTLNAELPHRADIAKTDSPPKLVELLLHRCVAGGPLPAVPLHHSGPKRQVLVVHGATGDGLGPAV